MFLLSMVDGMFSHIQIFDNCVKKLLQKKPKMMMMPELLLFGTLILWQESQQPDVL